MPKRAASNQALFKMADLSGGEDDDDQEADGGDFKPEPDNASDDDDDDESEGAFEEEEEEEDDDDFAAPKGKANVPSKPKSTKDKPKAKAPPAKKQKTASVSNASASSSSASSDPSPAPAPKKAEAADAGRRVKPGDPACAPIDHYGAKKANAAPPKTDPAASSSAPAPASAPTPAPAPAPAPAAKPAASAGSSKPAAPKAPAASKPAASKPASSKAAAPAAPPASGDAVLDHLRSTAAPINAQGVADAFRGSLGKSAAERHLQDLVDAGTVERKEAGKVVLYWASQKDVAPHGDGVHGLIMPNELRTAVGNGSVTGVATWLDSGGQIDCGWATRGNGYGITTLMLSCARGHLPVVDLLLERGASVDLQSSLGLSALMIAAVSGQPLVIRRLVSAGAQIDLRNRQGLNALQAAEVKGDNACVRILREHAAHLVHLQESADGDDHADVDNPVPKVTLRLCNPFADGAATHGKRRACDGSVLPPSKKAASGDATPRAATTEGAAKDPRTPFATTTPATGSADAEIVTVAAAPVAPAGAAVGMAALRADMRAELRAELRAEMRAEVEDEVRRESQHPSDGGIDAECDWEAAESHLSFATKILVWEQNQHRHREQRMRLHKLDDNHLNARVLRLSRSKLAPEVLAFFGVGSAGLKQWVSPAATKRMLSPIRVEFTQDAVGAGEEGIDEGGLSADLYDSFFSAVLANPTLFDTYDDGLPLPAKTARCHELGRPSPCGKCEGCAALHQLRAVGRVLAKQLLDGWVAPGPAPFVWHYLRESHESAVQTAERALDALERVDPMLSRTWRQMLILPIEVGTYGLTIENLTDNADDADTPLTDSNKREALRQACRQRLLLDRRPALEALHAGFAAGEHTGLYLWSVPELVQLMHGTSSFDLRALYAGGRNIIFDSTCAPGVRTMLTELLENGDAHEWGHEHARQLLQFCTAFSVLPPDDHDKSLRRKPIRVSSVPPDAEGGSELNTPTASTCGRELYVPEYPTLAALKERFEFAFEHMGTSGFQYS